MADFHADSNAAELARDLAALGLELTDTVEAASKRAGALVLAGAHAPRRTGALAASLLPDATSDKVVIGSPLRYATFVHWGAPRRHVKAQPFLLTALESSKAEVLDLYTAAASDALATVKG
jgi:phage gpG-like protein